MASQGGKATSQGCPVCEGPDSVTIEFDRPPVLLCTCDRCGKFIVRKETLDRLTRREDFLPSRRAISDCTQRHFQRMGRPLQIIASHERPLAQDTVTISHLMSLCREAMPAGAAASAPKAVPTAPSLFLDP